MLIVSQTPSGLLVLLFFFFPTPLKRLQYEHIDGIGDDGDGDVDVDGGITAAAVWLHWLMLMLHNITFCFKK